MIVERPVNASGRPFSSYVRAAALVRSQDRPARQLDESPMSPPVCANSVPAPAPF
jgi:hypothetical protein